MAIHAAPTFPKSFHLRHNESIDEGIRTKYFDKPYVETSEHPMRLINRAPPIEQITIPFVRQSNTLIHCPQGSAAH